MIVTVIVVALVSFLLFALLLYLSMYLILKPDIVHRNSEFVASDRDEQLAPLLEQHVRVLSEEIGNRSFGNYENLEKAGAYICQYWSASGLTIQREEYPVDGKPVANFFVEFKGSSQPEEIIVVGAHYDSIGTTCPGANDNGTGVASVLEIATRFKSFSPKRTVRFIAFVNEEPPYFATDLMGSAVHARGGKRREEKIVGMLSLETLGYYSNDPSSQRYPFPLSLFYPKQGNFVALISNRGSKELLAKVSSSFRRHADFPSLKLAAISFFPGISSSDQWSFWRDGYRAVMITDTAPFRYPHYHRDTDTFDQVDYQRLSRVVNGLEGVVKDLSNGSA